MPGRGEPPRRRPPQPAPRSRVGLLLRAVVLVPPVLLDFFFQDQQSRRLRQRLVLAKQFALQLPYASSVARYRRRLRARPQTDQSRNPPLGQVRLVNALAAQQLPESVARETLGLHDQRKLLLGFPLTRTTGDSLRGLRLRHPFFSRIPKPPRQRRLADPGSNRERRRRRPSWHQQLLHHVGLEGLAVLGHL